ncbi:hypothetical protein [Fusobacterium necrophorum]|uniref:Uncharacterized protein n=1 Tax=Fusobacterium necrophorum subsp. funduliforme TaxID=143387 RepID=A0A161QWH6_9FUSO|nr:hypothetical protein [Fusobacterium necrophorum]KYL05302.1 hypothetical protein A2J07_00775 [Fusobacterium necrophorum subsp. funduliforme]
MKNYLNDVIVPAMVAKIDIVDNSFLEFGMYPNQDDSFIISQEFSDRSATNFNHEIWKIGLGDKMIGAYRDKGSCTGIIKENYKVLCDFSVSDMEEANNLAVALEEMGKHVYRISKDFVTFEIDVIAGTSTGRDNVTALLLDSFLEFDGILDNTDVILDLETFQDLTLEDMAKVRNRDHRIYIVNDKNKCIYDFGLQCIIIESFFWQPHQSNRLKAKKKHINICYNQALDGMEILFPELREVIENSIDYKRIKEVFLCLGMEVDTSIPELEGSSERKKQANFKSLELAMLEEELL